MTRSTRHRAQGELDVTFEALAQHAEASVATARAQIGDATDTARGDVLFWLEAAGRTLASHRRDLADLHDNDELARRLRMIESKTRAMANSMDFAFLLDRERNLLSIGYSVTDGQLDPSCYDLLASEARLASFIAIAKHDVPSKHWFRLGRNVTWVDGGAALISWSGSMFEYLMPSLVMRAPIGSLLENTSRLIVRRQINFATKLGLPWGISESAYNVRDLSLTYQYSSFGVPGLGLKRGLGDNLVIAPYATALAAMVDPPAAARNLDAPRTRRRARSLRLLRGARLHPGAHARGQPRRDRLRVHGASPGDDGRRARGRAAARRDAQALSRGAPDAGGGVAAAGTATARGDGVVSAS